MNAVFIDRNGIVNELFTGPINIAFSDVVVTVGCDGNLNRHVPSGRP